MQLKCANMTREVSSSQPATGRHRPPHGGGGGGERRHTAESDDQRVQQQRRHHRRSRKRRENRSDEDDEDYDDYGDSSVCVSSTRSFSGDRYEDEDEEDYYEDDQSPSVTAVAPPFRGQQRHLAVNAGNNSASGGAHLPLRKDPPFVENGEILRELEQVIMYGEDRVPGSTRFPGASVPSHHPVGSTVEKDEFNKIIPESKKAPQLMTSLAVSVGCVSYGICMAYTSSAIPSMMQPNNTSPLTVNIGDYETTWMSSLLALGALFGSLSAVYLMDAVGRKATLLAFSVMSLFIGWTLLMAASQVWQLYAGRFLLGLGAGMEITISPVYITEICRPALRDVCGSFPQVFIALGILCCYIMGRSLEWNWLALASCLFLFPFTFGLYFIPESPPWLIYNDEEDLAYKSMLVIRGEEYDASIEINRIKDRLARHKNDLHALLHETEEFGDTTDGRRTPRNVKFRFRDIFKSSVLYPFIVILILMFLLQFSGQGAITFYTALIFEEADTIVDPNDCALIIGVSYFLSSILGLVLKKHVGRRILLLMSELGMAISQIAMGIYFYILNDVRTSNTAALSDMDNVRWLPLPILIIFTVSFNVGMGSLTWVVATEILPVRSRRWTHTLANVSSNLWWFVVTKTFKELYTNLGPFVPFFMYGSVCVFGFVFIYIFLPETHGKTSEETAKSFTGFRPVVKRTGCKAVCSMCHSTCQCVPLILRKNGRNPAASDSLSSPEPGPQTIATAATAAAISTMCSAVEA